MTTPSTVDILKRADSRWAARNADDPADPRYLEHLAAALEPVVDPSAAPAGSGEVEQLATVVAQLRTEVEQWRTKVKEHLASTERARQELAEARADTQRQVDRAVQTYKATIDQRDGAIDDLRIDLAAAKRERDQALEQLATAAADTRAEASLQRDADQRVLADATADRDRHRALLDQLLAAVLGDDHIGDVEYQTAAAVDLVNRVIEAYAAPEVHTHKFAHRGDGKRPGPCVVDGCGKPYPRKGAA